MGFVQILYIALHFFITSLFDLHYFLRELVIRVKSLLTTNQLHSPLLGSPLSASSSANHEHLLLQNVANELKKLQKLPNHLACLFLGDNFETKQVLMIIRWCSSLGIPSISLFDHQGIIASMRNDIRDKLDVLSKDSNLLPLMPYKVYRGFTSYCNSAPGEINLYLMSHQDGKAKFADIAKQLAASSQKVQQCDIEHKMNLAYPKEPEILLQFGNLRSNTTLGYPPWYLRLTQMMRLPDHNCVTVNDFAKAMRSYAHSQQRYGK